MKIFKGVLSLSFLIVVNVVVAGPAGVNPDLEKGTLGWRLPKPNFSVQDGAGRNGSKGLVWESKDTNVYCIAGYSVPFRPGQRLKVSIWIKDEGLSKGQPGFCVEYFGQKGYLDGVGSHLAPGQPKESGGWRKFEAVTCPMPPAAKMCSVDLSVSAGVTGRCVYDDIEVETVSVDTDALCFSSAADDKACEGRVRFTAVTFADLRGIPAEEIVATFDYESAKGRKSVKPDVFAEGRADVTIDVSDLKPGKQRISFTVARKGGQKLDTRWLPFERLVAPPQAKVRFDAHRRMIVDGKPVYPLLMYVTSDVRKDPRALPALDRGPFKMLMSYNTYISPEELDCLKAHGIRTFVSFSSIWGKGWWSPAEIGEWWDQTAFIARRVCELKEHPAVLGWYMADEPTPDLMPRARDRYKMVRAIDPEHPALIVLCHARQARDTQAACDVVGLDCYPVPGDGTEESRPGDLARATVDSREALAGLRGDKPFWFVPQAYPHEPGRARFPSFRELRSMVWQAIACGADGVLFYSLGEMLDNKEKPGYCFADSWNITCRVGQEIKDHEEMLLSTEPAPGLKDVPKGVVARAWRRDGKTLLVAVNTTHTPVAGELTMDEEKVRLDLGPDETFFR